MKIVRVISLARAMPTGPPLQSYQISKYVKGYQSYGLRKDALQTDGRHADRCIPLTYRSGIKSVANTILIIFIMVCETLSYSLQIKICRTQFCETGRWLTWLGFLYICIDVYRLLGETGEQDGYIPFYKLNILEKLEHWRSNILGWPELILHTPPLNLPKNLGYVILIQEAHGSGLAHLSEIATADMQRLYMQYFPVMSLQLMTHHLSSSWFWTRRVFIIIFLPHMGITVNGACPFERQSRFNGRVDTKSDGFLKRSCSTI